MNMYLCSNQRFQDANASPQIQFFPSNKNSILIIIAREEWQIGKESKQVKNGPSLFIFYVNQSICHILKTMEWRNAHKKTETPSLHQILLVFFCFFHSRIHNNSSKQRCLFPNAIYMKQL